MSTLTTKTLFCLFVLCSPFSAQEEVRPDLGVPEPERAPPSSSYLIVSLLYEKAVDGEDRFPLALPELVHFAQQSGPAAMLNSKELRLSDRKISAAALLYMSGNDAPLHINQRDQKTLGEYLKSGGLLFAEDVRPAVRRRARFADAAVAGTPFDIQFKALIADPLVLGGSGRWQKVPHQHPLYSSFFRFDHGPPPGATSGGTVKDLEMLEHRGRVAVFFSDLNISYLWGAPQETGRERALQFGVNLMVFAMARQAAGPTLR